MVVTSISSAEPAGIYSCRRAFDWRTLVAISTIKSTSATNAPAEIPAMVLVFHTVEADENGLEAINAQYCTDRVGSRMNEDQDVTYEIEGA
jgi:hypothetical protein